MELIFQPQSPVNVRFGLKLVKSIFLAVSCAFKAEGVFSPVWAKWSKFIKTLHVKLLKVSESEVTQSCLTLCNPMDTRLLCPWDFLGKSTGVGCHFLLQGTSWPRDRTQVSHIVDRRFTIWATREVLKSYWNSLKSFKIPLLSVSVQIWGFIGDILNILFIYFFNILKNKLK